MIVVLSYVLSALFMTISVFYILSKTYNIKCSFSIRFAVTFILSISIFASTYNYVPPFFRQMLIIILPYFISRFYYKIRIKQSILGTTYLQIICVASEAIYGIGYFLLMNNDNAMQWSNSIIGTIISNTLIPLIMILITNFKLFRNIYKKFNLYTKYLNDYQLLFLSLFFYLIVNSLFYGVHYLYYLNKTFLFILIVLIFILYTIVLFIILYASNKYEKVKGKYTLSLENLKSYEEMLDQYRVANHENKNQLLLIRNMSKDKKLKLYIDDLIDNREKDDNNIYNMLKRIPSSSIRAVIYSKILIMKNKEINYNLEIDRSITAKDFSKISNTILLDICNVLNVFIDNAIDGVLLSKNKQILIFLNKTEKNIEISISNTCNQNISIEKIYNTGYTTKGENHGYGLSLVKDTINNNYGILENKTEIINDIFTQYLYIKID